MKKINSACLFVKDLPKAHELEELVKKELLDNDIKIVDDSYDLAISIGGDGTFLKMIRANNYNDNIYYLGINGGSLGFLSSCNKDDIKEFIKSLSNDYQIIELPLIKTVINNKEYYSINELTVRNSDFSTMKSHIYVNDILLEYFVGDGLVISSSTGSTAYNLSLGGPIIDNDLDVFSLTPLAPINSKIFNTLINSMVLANSKELVIIPDNSKVLIINDGKVDNIDSIEKISVSLSSKKIKCIVAKDYNYIKLIQTKIINTKE